MCAFRQIRDNVCSLCSSSSLAIQNMGLSMGAPFVKALFDALDEESKGVVHCDEFARMLFNKDNMVMDTTDHMVQLAKAKAKKIAQAAAAAGLILEYGCAFCAFEFLVLYSRCIFCG